MDATLEELKEMIAMKAADRLLARSRGGKVSWRHIAQDGTSQDSAMCDFEQIGAALSGGEDRYSFMIHLQRDGTALVGWHIYENAGREG